MIETVELVLDDPRWEEIGLGPLAERAARAALAAAGVGAEAEIALLATDDARMAELNAAFRGKAAPTNVLSWPAADLAPGTAPAEDRFGRAALGDLALGYETCAAEAAAAGRPLADHAAHLVIHGVLHLLGHDHETDAEAAAMEELEVRALASMGLPAPY